MTLITRILLGIIYLIFGLNGFFKFIQIPPVEGAAAQFLGAMFTTGFGPLIKILEILGGLMLLTNMWSKLALLFITPITIVIFLFHLLIVGEGLSTLPILLLILNILQIKANGTAFAPLIKKK